MYGLPYYAHGNYSGGMTWVTKTAEGFSKLDIEFFNGIMPALSTLIQLLIKDLCTCSILKTYLGNDPGTRVYNGSIERGDCITVRSVIWFSDIRGFGNLSEMLDRDMVISLINDTFEIIQSVLQDKGGEILKFLGGGLMGVFETESGNEAVVCKRAREAAELVQTRLRGLHSQREESGLPSAEMGIGLHYGDASYGNIGSPNRLDFTLIGHSVNVASRIEGLCSDRKLSVLASSDFVKLDSNKDVWRSYGKQNFKGVSEQVEVYELASARKPRERKRGLNCITNVG